MEKDLYPIEIDMFPQYEPKEHEVIPYLWYLDLSITEKCNFKCRHCLSGQKRSAKCMSLEDIELVIRKAVNPSFSKIRLFGGEPTMHPDFMDIPPLITGTMREFGVSTKNEKEEKARNSIAHIKQSINKILEPMLKSEKEELSRTGELTNIYLRHTYQVPGNLDLGMFTNGHNLLSTKERFIEDLKELSRLGMSRVTVSTDKTHIEYAKKAELSMDYSILDSCAPRGKGSSFDNIKKALGKDVYIRAAGNGNFVVPIGAARNMPWEELIRLQCKAPMFISPAQVWNRLNDEYSQWPDIKRRSHCYCSIANLFKQRKKVENYRAENRFHEYSAFVDPHLNAHVCTFEILPPIANLRDYSFDEIYHMALDNPLYKIIAEEGPQGLARRRTNLSESEIRKLFIKRTPCGLCEDLMRGVL